VHPDLDLGGLRSLMRNWLAAHEIAAVIYEMPAFTLIMRGPYLRQWIADDPLQAIIDKYGLSVV
jgi:hypothetical protein